LKGIQIFVCFNNSKATTVTTHQANQSQFICTRKLFLFQFYILVATYFKLHWLLVLHISGVKIIPMVYPDAAALREIAKFSSDSEINEVN